MRKPMVNLDAALAAVLGAELVENGPMFCSLDHVVEFASEFGNPFDILAAQEEDSGIPVAFDRECDREIRKCRGQKA